MKLFNEKIQSNKDYLSQLDTPIGDADHGNNMSRGMKYVMDAINENEPEEISDLFKLITTNLLSKVGGASGPLYASAFMGMMKVVDEQTELSTILSTGLESIQMRGKAEKDDKTMVDLWIDVVEAVKNNQLTHELIDQSVNDTKELKAKKGRASYVGDRSVGHIDPGAYSSGLLFHSMIEAGIE